jgi:hypothetical protein
MKSMTSFVFSFRAPYGTGIAHAPKPAVQFTQELPALSER